MTTSHNERDNQIDVTRVSQQGSLGGAEVHGWRHDKGWRGLLHTRGRMMTH